MLLFKGNDEILLEAKEFFMQAPFVCTIEQAQVKPFTLILEEAGFFLSKPEHTIFSAKKPGLSITLYQSLKLTIQGKQAKEFIEYTLEPFFGSFNFSLKADKILSEADKIPHIGTDEAGKGDFFGPLVIAGVYIDESLATQLLSLGIKDSKLLSDKKIHSLAPAIAQLCPNYILRLMPQKYNELYKKFGNLNHMLAWCHATVIDHLVSFTGCKNALVDKFAHESLIERQLRQKKTICSVTQRTKAESDTAVAAASCLARFGFLQGMDMLSKQLGFSLPKGSSSPHVRVTAKKIVNQFGPEGLYLNTKMHFKITQQITGIEPCSDELK